MSSMLRKTTALGVAVAVAVAVGLGGSGAAASNSSNSTSDCPWFLHNDTALIAWGEMTMCQDLVAELTANSSTTTTSAAPTTPAPSYATGEDPICRDQCQLNIQYVAFEVYQTCYSSDSRTTTQYYNALLLQTLRSSFRRKCGQQTPPELCPAQFRNITGYNAWVDSSTCGQPSLVADFCDTCVNECGTNMRQTPRSMYQSCLDFLGNSSSLGSRVVPVLEQLDRCDSQCGIGSGPGASGAAPASLWGMTVTGVVAAVLLGVASL